MMQRLEKRAFSRDEAYKLTEKMVHRGAANYVIRDALIEKGFSAATASDIIREVRKAQLDEYELENSLSSQTQIAMLIIALILILFMFFYFSNPV